MLSLTSPSVLAGWRAAMITAGVLAALLMNTLVFPKHCRVNTGKFEVIADSDLPKYLSDAFLAKCEPYSRFIESAVLDAQQVPFMVQLDGFF